jgi:lipopolysaccharide/colanic/teichoic acid biosynthesis glycosyltransferase
LIAIIILALPMLIIALIVKLDSPGPALFKQKRVGLHKTHFNILKFRSMRTDTPHDAPTHQLQGATSYITKVGAFLRKTSLDELPQLFNILFGDMSLVGPRPERIENVYEYTRALPDFDLRHRVKGGLTGYAQIYGKYNTSPADKLNMDLIYIEQYSFLMGIKLILMTIKTLQMNV